MCCCSKYQNLTTHISIDCIWLHRCDTLSPPCIHSSINHSLTIYSIVGKYDMNVRSSSSTADLTCYFGKHLSSNHEIQPQTLLTQPWLSHQAHHGSIFSQGGEQPTKTWDKILVFCEHYKHPSSETIPQIVSPRIPQNLLDNRLHISHIIPVILSVEFVIWPPLLQQDLGCKEQEQQGWDCEH